VRLIPKTGPLTLPLTPLPASLARLQALHELHARLDTLTAQMLELVSRFYTEQSQRALAAMAPATASAAGARGSSGLPAAGPAATIATLVNALAQRSAATATRKVAAAAPLETLPGQQQYGLHGQPGQSQGGIPPRPPSPAEQPAPQQPQSQQQGFAEGGWRSPALWASAQLGGSPKLVQEVVPLLQHALARPDTREQLQAIASALGMRPGWLPEQRQPPPPPPPPQQQQQQEQQQQQQQQQEAQQQLSLQRQQQPQQWQQQQQQQQQSSAAGGAAEALQDTLSPPLHKRTLQVQQGSPRGQGTAEQQRPGPAPDRSSGRDRSSGPQQGSGPQRSSSLLDDAEKGDPSAERAIAVLRRFVQVGDERRHPVQSPLLGCTPHSASLELTELTPLQTCGAGSAGRFSACQCWARETFA
jgi:hypothetical protein